MSINILIFCILFYFFFLKLLNEKKNCSYWCGISGLSCAWKLSEKFDVDLYECEKRFGGHSNTVTIKEGKMLFLLIQDLLFLMNIITHYFVIFSII